MSKTKAVKAAAKAAGPVMYVGPNLKGIAIYGTVYNRVPDAVQVVKAEVPQLPNLFIPVKEYGAAEKMIRDQKGYIYEAYKEAEKYRQKDVAN